MGKATYFILWLFKKDIKSKKLQFSFDLNGKIKTPLVDVLAENGYINLPFHRLTLRNNDGCLTVENQYYLI